MLKLVQEKTDGALPQELQFLFVMPEATHVANWFLYKGGERFNLSNLRTLYSDPNPEIQEMRSAVTFSVVQNQHHMSVPHLLAIKSLYVSCWAVCHTSHKPLFPNHTAYKRETL